MRKKGSKAALTSVIVAGILVVVLLIAGTILRMQTRDMKPWDAFRSFVSDTIHPWR